MTQKKILRNSKGRDIDVQSKEKMIGVINVTSRKGKTRIESLHD
jgi:hypothetical protein